jgi:hypothetical protein
MDGNKKKIEKFSEFVFTFDEIFEIFNMGVCGSPESFSRLVGLIGSPQGRCRPLSDGTRKVLERFQSSVALGS